MGKAFLQSVAEYVFNNYKDTVEKLCIVLPNKRGALFLKNHLSRTFGKTIWLPAIISAEDLAEELSQLKTLEEIDLLCQLYESYRACYGPDAEPFDSFAKWGQLILQDFNEIDRYLADPEQLYENLKDIKVIENWSLGEETLSEYQTAYLKFMSSLGRIYKHFTSFLLSNGWAYQGLAYRQAVKNLADSPYPDKYHKLIFCGFNALNAAEQKIFNFLQVQKKADLLWDADTYYLHNENQEAGLFLRNNFNHFLQRDPSFIENNFKSPKNIRIVSVPKQTGQAQVVKQQLQSLIDKGVPLDKVAVVLANEKLLWPVLHQLPAAVEHVNITMEYPLRYSSTYAFIELLVQLQVGFSKQNRAHKTIYHKDFIALFRQPLFQNYLKAIGLGIPPGKIVNQVTARNLSFLSQKNLHQLLGDSLEPLQPLLTPLTSVPAFSETIHRTLHTIMDFFAGQVADNQRNLELEYIQIIIRHFNRLTELLSKYPHFTNLQAYKQLFTQVVGNSSAPFIGEPLKGLQIMGVLETRTLDFEHLIFVNVNEGVLPSGKSIHSFIPNDLKRAFGLPLYIEKDAIYAYHFYRLLQRAAEITITYDSETDTFGKGEKSRFITQLQLEMRHYNPQIAITEEVASYPGFGAESARELIIPKNERTLASIIKKATTNDEFGGLSPSGLITFKECSLKFYFRYGARLKETREIEESAEANTFGSILHLSLENLYREFTGRILQPEVLKEKLKDVDSVVNTSFISFFDNAPPAGKSLLQEEVIKVYVKKLVNNDIRYIQDLNAKNALLTLKNLEQEFSATLAVPVNGTPTTLYIKGKIDRIDSTGEKVRVIDYKSSVKDSDKFVFEDFDTLFHDKNYNKQLQLLLYAWLLHKNNFCPAEKIMPGIVPFKVFLEEPKYILGPDKKPLVLSDAFLDAFEQELTLFVAGIFDETRPFEQTDDETVCEFCPYRVICHYEG